MHRIAAAFVLFVATLSSDAALVSGPQRPISPPKPGPSSIEKILAVATDGTDFLTLWSEWDEPRRGMYAAVLSEDGVARAVTPGPFSDGFSLARAVWTGDAYLVVYHDAADGPPIAVRMNRDAQIISERSVLDVGPGFVTALAWNGTRAFALVWTGHAVSGALLDSRGRVRHSRIPIPATDIGTWTVTTAGNDFLVAWSDTVEPLPTGGPVTAVRAVRVSPDGEVSAPVELMPPTKTQVLHVASASSGGEAGVVFTTRTFPDSSYTLHRVTIDGSTLAVEAHPGFSVLESTQAVGVIPVSGGFAAMYAFYPPTNGAQLRLGTVRFDSDARLSIPIGQVVPFRGIGAVTNGRKILLAIGDITAVAVMLNADATKVESPVVPVSIATAQQTNPALASAGNQMLAAWIEPDFPRGSVLLAQRRNANGDPIDAEPIVVARGSVTGTPAIAFTGKVWLLAWSGSVLPDEHVYVKRMSPEGVVLDPTPVDVGIGWRCALASNGTVTALVMDNARPAEIRLVRFSPEGNLVDSTALTAANPRNHEPSIATNGTEFFVAWDEERRNIVGRRLAADGTPMDAAPVAIADSDYFSRGGTRVASNGGDFMVAYAQWEPIPIVDPPIVEPPPTVYRVFTKRVLRNGTLADTTSGQDGALAGEGLSPRIAAFGSGYVATFLEAEKKAYAVDDRVTLFAVPLDERGAPTAMPAAVVRNVRSYSNEHSLAVIGPRIEVAYSRVAPQFANVHRVYLRALAEQGARRRPSSQ